MERSMVRRTGSQKKNMLCLMFSFLMSKVGSFIKKEIRDLKTSNKKFGLKVNGRKKSVDTWKARLRQDDAQPVKSPLCNAKCNDVKWIHPGTSCNVL